MRLKPEALTGGWAVIAAVAALSLCLVCPAAFAGVGIVTWVHPAATTSCLRVESAVTGVAAALRDADGHTVPNQKGLLEAGWRIAADGLWETPPRAGGGRLTLTVTGLPAGTHQVFFRFFSQPRVPGNEWWFITRAGLADQKGTGYTYEKAVVIQGTGGHDSSTIYEAKVGSVGSEGKPVASVSFWFERYQWSQVSRVGSIRIETTPSMAYAETQERTPGNEAVRSKLLRNGPALADGKHPYGFGVVSGALKVRPKSFRSLENREIAAGIRMGAARGEYESRQVLLYSASQSLDGVRLEPGELVGPNGMAIPVSDTLFSPVGYCPYSVPADLDIHGYWPEPVLTFLKSFPVQQHDVQSLWFRVRVPADAAPGDYRGTVTIRPGNAPPATVPVHLTVWGVDMPQMPYLRVVVGCNRTGPFEMSYGLNPSSIYGFKEEWIQELPTWAAAGATAVDLGYIWGKQIDQKTKLPTPEQLDEWVKQVRHRYQAATEAGLRHACYLYMFDEAKAEWDPAMRAVSERLRKEFPDLLLLTTAHRAWHANGSVKDGGGTIPDINGWCPLIMHYDLEKADEARRHGKQVWWYTCNSPQKPYPNVLMTHPLIDTRLLMGFMAFAFKTDGFLYYATAGGYYKNMPAITSGPYTEWSIQDNAHNHLYQKGPDGPLPSLRLENLRDGLEDYNLLYIARKQRDALHDRGRMTPQLAKLEASVSPYFAPQNSLVRSLRDFSQDPAELERVRRAVAAFCEAAGPVLLRP